MLAWLNEYRAILHLGLHVWVPLLVAGLLLKWPLWQGFVLKQLPKNWLPNSSWVFVSIFTCLMLTMVVDVDHLLAVPIYAPNRCSIFFHPLHQSWAISLYVLIFSWLSLQAWQGKSLSYGQKLVSLLCLGLIIHMLLDGADCIWMKACS